MFKQFHVTAILCAFIFMYREFGGRPLIKHVAREREQLLKILTFSSQHGSRLEKP